MHAMSERPILGFTQVTEHILNIICAMNFSGDKFNQFSDMYMCVCV